MSKLMYALEKFKESFGDNFVVGGSLALYQHGFECAPNDIDLEFETKDQSIIKTFELLNATFLGCESACRYPNYEKHYRFRFYEVIFDVWVVEKIDYKSWMYKDYIRYADVLSVFKKKMKMQRPKDFSDLLKYIEQIQKLMHKNS